MDDKQHSEDGRISGQALLLDVELKRRGEGEVGELDERVRDIYPLLEARDIGGFQT